MLPSQLLHLKSLLNSTHQSLLLTLPVFDEAAKITIGASHIIFFARSLSQIPPPLQAVCTLTIDLLHKN